MSITNSNWSGCKKILCIRPDNMGDLIMSGPAIRALKLSFNAEITVLTSSLASLIATQMEEIDEVITFDLPWVKHNNDCGQPINELVEKIRQKNFDAAVVFTVYSQNPLPTVMLAYLAGIPKRLAYCRENPYQLLTDWVPEQEPFGFIRHQVKRDLELVAAIGAHTKDENLHLDFNQDLWCAVDAKLKFLDLDTHKKWLILHPGVSEAKREYPVPDWVAAGKLIIKDLGYKVLLTGSAGEKTFTENLQRQIGTGCCSAAGLFNIEELITLISRAPVMISVNTGTVHIAAAVGTPVVVLYALTNPQHTPWGTPAKILPFRIDKNLRSKNQVICYVDRLHENELIKFPDANDIIAAVIQLVKTPDEFICRDLAVKDRVKECGNLL